MKPSTLFHFQMRFNQSEHPNDSRECRINEDQQREDAMLTSYDGHDVSEVL